MSKIGIDIRTVCGKKAGKGWYTFHLVKWLLSLDHKSEYVLYTNTISGDVAKMLAFGPKHSAHSAYSAYSAKNFHIKVIHKNAFLWHFAVIKDFLKEKGEAFFSPTSFIIGAFLPKKIKSIITVHDLISFIHPHLHQTKATVIEHLFFRRALKKAAQVLVPSLNTKNDLVKIFKLPAGKIAVTHLAADESFFAHGKNSKEVREKYNLPEEFILTVGGLEPRKNIGKLVDCMPEILNEFPKMKLVIVGGKGWKSRALQKKITNLAHIVIHVENCDSNDLPVFYRCAKLFVFPSIYEGFGLPPLEAMACGCPVVCSSAGSLREVCGDAALLIDPDNNQAITDSILKILKNKDLRDELIGKGLEQARKFSWEETARKTLGVF